MNTATLTTTQKAIKSLVLFEGPETTFISPIQIGSYHSPLIWVKCEYEAYKAGTFGTVNQELVGIYPVDRNEGALVTSSDFDLMRYNVELIKLNGLQNVNEGLLHKFYLRVFTFSKPAVYTPAQPYYYRLVFYYVDDFIVTQTAQISQLDVNTNQLGGLPISQAHGVQNVSVPVAPGTSSTFTYPQYTHK